MKKYKVLTPVTLFQGLIGLDDRQAKDRLHCLGKTASDGVYDVLQKVTFKAGETIGLEQVSKAHEPHLLDIEAAEAELEGVESEPAEAEADKKRPGRPRK